MSNGSLISAPILTDINSNVYIIRKMFVYDTYIYTVLRSGSSKSSTAWKPSECLCVWYMAALRIKGRFGIVKLDPTRCFALPKLGARFHYFPSKRRKYQVIPLVEENVFRHKYFCIILVFHVFISSPYLRQKTSAGRYPLRATQFHIIARWVLVAA